jgi:hypothetical protein
LERFSLLQAAQESKQNVFILKNVIKSKTKTLQIAAEFFKYKKTFSCLKKIWETNQNKSFGPKFFSTDRKRFVSFQNFVSKTNIFDLFWNTSAKTKAFHLERKLV